MQIRASSLVLTALMLVAGCGGSDPAPIGEPSSGESSSAPSAGATDTSAASAPVQPVPPVQSAEPARSVAPADAVEPVQPEATAAVAPEPEETATDEFAGWTRFRHPLGAEFHHPPDWRVDETAMGLLLVPPDLAPDRELIVAFGSPAQGVTDPKDTSVGQTLDAMMMQTMPGLRRSGRPKSVATRGAVGASFDYRGKAPDGRSARCRIFIVIMDDFAVSLSVFGDSKSFRGRAPVVEKIFSSLDDGREGSGDGDETPALSADIDPKLVGVFRGESIASGSGVYVNTQLVYALNADGTVLYGAQSHMNASQRDSAGNLRWTADGRSGGNVDRGRWSARSGFLSFQWDDGTSGRLAYGFEPDGTLVLRNARTRELINIYSRVR